MVDIGQLIFVEFLRMSQYPASPFTGNIISDLVMFLFIPSVFLIIIVYTIMNRLMSSKGSRKIKLLIGVALYLTVVFQGLYATFAYLAGPYFLFLIFIYGLLYFAIEHFPVARSDQELIELGGARYHGERLLSHSGQPRAGVVQGMLHDFSGEKDKILDAQIKALERAAEIAEKNGAKQDFEGLASIITRLEMLKHEKREHKWGRRAA